MISNLVKNCLQDVYFFPSLTGGIYNKYKVKTSFQSADKSTEWTKPTLYLSLFAAFANNQNRFKSCLYSFSLPENQRTEPEILKSTGHQNWTVHDLSFFARIWSCHNFSHHHTAVMMAVTGGSQKHTNTNFSSLHGQWVQEVFITESHHQQIQ